MLAKCVLIFLKLNWNQCFLGKQKENWTVLLTSSTQLQNRSFYVVGRKRTSAKCPKMKIARAKHAKLLFFSVKYANLWRSCWGGAWVMFTNGIGLFFRPSVYKDNHKAVYHTWIILVRNNWKAVSRMWLFYTFGFCGMIKTEIVRFT